MNYDKTAKLAKAFQALAFAAERMNEEFFKFLNLFNDFYNDPLKIQDNKKFIIRSGKCLRSLTVTEICFPLLPYGYISGIPP